MAAGAQTRGWSGPSRRRVPRFQMQAPLDVTVLRSGIPDTVPGRSVNVCERGISAMLAGELVPGEAVGVEVQLPMAAAPLRTRATVRYQDKLRCGLEFVGLSADQRTAIRNWAKGAATESLSSCHPGASKIKPLDARITETGIRPRRGRDCIRPAPARTSGWLSLRRCCSRPSC